MIPKNDKISAFSLTEMLVVLVLSSIIVTIIYFSFYTVTTYQVNLTRRYKTLNDLSGMYFLLKKDFDRCTKAEVLTEYQINLDVQKTEIVYSFSDSFITREQASRVDTFWCQLEQVTFKWMGAPVENSKKRIDEIELNVSHGSSMLKMKISKQYDAAMLLENKNDTIP